MWTAATDGAHNGGGVIWGNLTGDIYFATLPHTSTSSQTLSDANVSSKVKMVLTSDGRVGIGTDNPPTYARLAVKGLIMAEEVRVRLHPWPDYVFDGKYKLMPLPEVEAFIQANKHLPNIPSALSLEQNGGVDMGEMQAKQMEKIEELTLYIIELNKQLQELKVQNEKQQEQIEKLKEN
jgi:hypothetical protein